MSLKYVSLFGAILLTSGCATNGLPSYDYEAVPAHVIESTEKMFIGVPAVLALEGSSARYNEDWIVTVAHNYIINPSMIRHPRCDIALIKKSGSNTAPVGKLYKNEKAYMVGYPAYSPLAVNEGEYITDFIDENGCRYSALKGAVMSGMSGGGAYNSKGELVGVNVGISDLTLQDGTRLDNVSTIIAFPSVQPWIDSVIQDSQD